ncbi:MAG: hypothetical protein OIF58_02095 [Cohaesibacter sp.]|nr:hypothetical protein [Cohaesibacter sp.]
MSEENIGNREDREVVNFLVDEIFLPNLQKSVEEAHKKASMMEVLSASSNAYLHLLENTIGLEAASVMLQSMADHMKSRSVATKN